MRNRVRVMCKPGSVGDLGGQPPRSTRPAKPRTPRSPAAVVPLEPRLESALTPGLGAVPRDGSADTGQWGIWVTGLINGCVTGFRFVKNRKALFLVAGMRFHRYWSRKSCNLAMSVLGTTTIS